MVELLLLTQHNMEIVINADTMVTAEYMEGSAGSRIILKDGRCVLVDQSPREIFELVKGVRKSYI